MDHPLCVLVSCVYRHRRRRPLPFSKLRTGTTKVLVVDFLMEQNIYVASCVCVCVCVGVCVQVCVWVCVLVCECRCVSIGACMCVYACMYQNV